METRSRTYGVNSEARFQVNARNGNHGAVKAFATAPSGKTYPVDVLKKDGIFTANFTPSETGDWLISILHGNEHIPESPFRVRVNEPSRGVKVRGLEDAMLGRLANFSIETTEPATGDLSVDITYNGRGIPAKIEGEGPNRYHISFTPIGSGTYIIHVYFSGVEVQGSPYTMEVIDASDVIATGESLTTAEINYRSSFFLNLGINGSANDVKVIVTSPRGYEVPAAIMDNRNGKVTVEFVPMEVGDHQIDVFYFGKPIAKSPFRCQVFDRTKISVMNLPTTGVVGKLVEFDIDASLAGSGNIEITVNDGTVTCNVEKRGSRQFQASFVPMDPIPHYIKMRFNDLDIPGSPWKIEVRNPAVVTVDSRAVQLVPVGLVSEFEVHTGTIYDEIQVNVTGPSNRTARANVLNLRNGFYRVEFIPMESGTHLIEVLYDGVLVPGAPFISKAYNSSAISVSPVSVGVVGIPVEFSIDVSRAGEGQLEIMVNRGSVPNNVRMIDKTHFMVSFIPREPGPHIVEIKFNGEPIPQGALTIPIMDSSGRTTVLAQGNGLREVAVNQQSYFQLHRTQAMAEADLEVKVTSPTGELVPAKMVLQPDGDYKVEYSSRFTGRHTVEITHLGVAIMGSPFFVEIYDPSKIRIEGNRTGKVGQRMEFDIIRHLAGKAELKLQITGPRGNVIRYDMYTIAKGEHVVYIPREPGIYKIDVTYGGLEVPGCPIKQDITDNSLVTAHGDGLLRACEDQIASFYVDSRGQRGDLHVQVEGPNSISKCNIEPEVGGRYKVNYIPVEVGIFNVHIRWNGQELEESPFHPRVFNPRKVMIVGGWPSILDANNQMQLRRNQMKTIEVDTSNAGPGQLTAELIGPGGNVPVDITSRGRDRYAISFTPHLDGEYDLRIMWNGVLLERCPVSGICRSTWNEATSSAQSQKSSGTAGQGQQMPNDMVDHRYEKKTTTQVTQNTQNSSGAVEHPYSLDKVIMTGMGLQHAMVNQLAEFFIDGSSAGEGSPTVRLSGSNHEIIVDCRPVPGQSYKYRCTYTPRVPGTYMLYVNWADREVIGSPYKVNVIRGADAKKVVCVSDSLRVGGIVGQEIRTTIDTRRAGPGELTAECTGPTKKDSCHLRDHENGTFTLTIKPLEAGKHILQVKYNGEHVLGSPFTLKIAGVPDPSKVRVSGPGILDGYLHSYQSHFYVDTHGAGGGELTVKIRGPKAAFRIEMQRQSEKHRRIACRYEPTEPGLYNIFVRWSGIDVPGSPFRVQLMDGGEE